MEAADVQRAAGGDHEAFERLYHGHVGRVHALARRMALMEQQLESIEGSMKRLEEVGEFHRALDSGEPPVAPKV